MSYIDKQIVQMRKNNSYVRTILDWVIKQEPLLDEIVCLARVLNVLDQNNMAVSRKEVRTAFNKYYHRDFHGDKGSYINWLCSEFHVKDGTLVNSSQIRVQASEKKPISVISQENKAVNGHKIKDLGKCKVNDAGGLE